MDPGEKVRERGVIAPEGIPFLLGGVALVAVLSFVWPRTLPASVFGILITVFVGWFFRNPERFPPALPGAVISPADGKIVYVQIAGFVARRVVCDVAPGDTVRAGQRVGIICFGSRVDILLPASASLNVRVGDRVRAGESVVGVVK
jgi:phosphatidylserine decarboxylase